MTAHYTYRDCLRRAERITWKVEDLIGPGRTLDFSRPFLPESLACARAADCLDADEQRALNQIRAHAYLSIFGLVEEFILPFVLDHARPILSGDDWRARAFLEFASEEAKHIQLFHMFRDEFTRDFGFPCAVIGPPETVAGHVLSHTALSVALLTLHIEWMTQRHYLDSVRDDQALDPAFKSLLLHHWMEEHQHAQLDTLMVESIAEALTPVEIEEGVDGYLALVGFLDDGLKQQTAFDLDALEGKIGRKLDESARAGLAESQLRANRWTYIGSGMSHPKFLETLNRLAPPRAGEIEGLAPRYS